MQPVFQPQCGRGLLVRVGTHPGEQGEPDAGNGRVHPGCVHAHPQRQRQRYIQRRGSPAPPLREDVPGRQHDGRREPCRGQPPGEQDSDQGDGTEVVDDGEAEQQHPQRGGHVRPRQGQHAECEGDVGGDGDRPAVRGPGRAPADRQEHQRGNDHAAEGRGDRQHGGPAVRQLPDDQLAFELKTGDEEEHREQPVGHPSPGAQLVQMQPGRAEAHAGLPHVMVTAAGEVGPQQGDHGGGQQQEPAGGLLAEELGELATSGQRLAHTRVDRGSHVDHRSGAHQWEVLPGNADAGRRPDFPAHQFSSDIILTQRATDFPVVASPAGAIHRSWSPAAGTSVWPARSLPAEARPVNIQS